MGECSTIIVTNVDLTTLLHYHNNFSFRINERNDINIESDNMFKLLLAQYF